MCLKTTGTNLSRNSYVMDLVWKNRTADAMSKRTLYFDVDMQNKSSMT